MLATKLIVTATDYGPGDSEYMFPAYELGDGLIAVVANDTNDWLFYENRESIEAYGEDSICDVSETHSIKKWDLEDLKESIRASLTKFGNIPPKALALLG